MRTPAQGNKYCQRREGAGRVLGPASSTAPFPKALGLPETSTPLKQLLPTHHRPHAGARAGGQYCAEMMLDDFKELVANIKAGDTATANVEKWDPASWPKEAKGVGTPPHRAAWLGHWIRIKDGKIDNYQCVVPTTWNGSPA
jgi:hydrogenase large subunit